MRNPDFNTFKKNEVDLSKKDSDYEKRDIDIYPCKISRRVLAYFADLIIALFVSVFFFEMAVLPIGKLTSSYMEQAKNVSTYSNARVNILYQNNLLFFDDGEELNMQENLVTTSDEFTEFYVYDNSRVTSEVFYHYFCEIRDYDVDFLNNLYLKYGQDYLDTNNFTILGTYQFKEDVVNLFKPKFVPGDELSETGSTEYDHFQSVFFLNMYSEMLNDIKVNDLNPTIEMEHTYNGYTKLVDEFDVFYRNLITICAVISFFIATSVLNFIIPLINHKGRTISEMVLKIEHVYINNIEYLTKKDVFIEGLFNTLNNFPIFFLISMATLGFGGIFSLTYLLIFSLTGIVFALFEFILICTTRLSQSLKEFGTQSIVCETQLIDEYYRLKNYEF